MRVRKAKFNVVDLVIIIVIVLILLFGIYKYITDFSSFGTESVSITYVIEVDQIDNTYTGNVSIGDTVFDADTGNKIGTVVSTESTKAMYTGADSNGEQVVSEMPDKSNLFITIKADADYSDNEYTISNSEVYVGKTLSVELPNLFCTGSCVNLTPES